MDNAEKQLYVRNLAIVVQCEHCTSAERDSLACKLITKIGATSDAWMIACSHSVRDADVDLRPFRRLSTRVRCLEDMVELAFSDKRLGENEKSLLFGAARDAGITRQQLTQIIDEAKARWQHPA